MEFDVIRKALQLNSRISVLWSFCRTCDFRASFFRFRVQKENPEIMENIYLIWLAMWLNHFEIDVFWAAFLRFLWSCILTFKYFWFLMNFRDLRLFVFENEKPEITENLYFVVYNTPMHLDLCFEHYFNFLSMKTDINKNRLNLLYSEGSKAFTTQLAAAWLAMWLDHFETVVIWTVFKEFLKLHNQYFGVFWWISEISVWV